jgi:flagellar protein FliO/FliZ
MRSNRCLRLLAFAGTWAVPISSTAFAENPSPKMVISRPDAAARVPAPLRSKTSGANSESSGGWWLGSAGIAAALAVFGGVSLASKRFVPSKDSGPFQVVGRSALSPKHSVYLLRVGDRVLILGTGPQGPPSTLGEVTDPVELARLAPRRSPRPDPGPAVSPRLSTGFDRRIGDDE